MQLDAFSIPYRRTSAPSRAGAAQSEPKSAGQRATALTYIRACGDATIHEIAQHMRIVDGTASRIVRQLVLAKQVVDSGRTRANAHSGIQATLWVAR